MSTAAAQPESVLWQGLPQQSCVVAVVPHPDDEAYAFGAALLAASQHNLIPRVVCATRGGAGLDFSGSTAPLTQTRSQELAQSCAHLGAGEPIFLDCADGEVAQTKDLDSRLLQVFSQLAPAVVFTLGEDGVYGHRDHVALATATHRVCAQQSRPLYTAQFPFDLWEVFRKRMQQSAPGMLVNNGPGAGRLGTKLRSGDICIEVGPHAGEKHDAMVSHVSQLPQGKLEKLFSKEIVDFVMRYEWLRPVYPAPHP